MLFKKDKRKEYMKLIGIKYGKDEMKEIKNIFFIAKCFYYKVVISLWVVQRYEFYFSKARKKR